MRNEANEALIRQFYEKLWDEWRLEVAEQIVAKDVRFRGALGTTLRTTDMPRRFHTRGAP